MDKWEERCKSCAYSSPFDGEGNGCTSWDCEYINRKDAIRAYKDMKSLMETMRSLEEALSTALKREEVNNG